MQKNEKKNKVGYSADPSEMRKAPGYEESVPGVNSPNIELPAINPPVPNRAWTEMKRDLELNVLSDEEKRDLYIGRNRIL